MSGSKPTSRTRAFAATVPSLGLSSRPHATVPPCAAATRTVDKSTSEHSRNQSPLNSLHVLGVSAEVSCQELFLIKQTPKQKRHRRHDRQQSPVRSERERHPEKIQRSPRIHRMPHPRIWPCRD